jgi:osmoprotectant transport system permease protein
VRRWLTLALVLLLAAASPWAAGADDAPLVIGSKKFTESVILGEIACDLARNSGAPARHLKELGGTRILWDALLAGSIDLYPEYTGTLRHEILVGEKLPDDAALAAALARRGLGMSLSLGFGDTYALGMLPEVAARLKITRISDLAAHPDIRFGLSNEFLNRGDGWPGLRDSYGLARRTPVGLDHDIAYRALGSGAVDVIDLYSTDAEIAARHLTILTDDRRYFPAYDAVIVYRADAATRHPAALAAILRLQGAIDTGAMITMNARVRLDRMSEAAVAAQFVSQRFGIAAVDAEPGLAARVLQRTGEHLVLTLTSLAAAIVVAIPLGILAARRPRLGRAIVGATGILQTIPSLALLVMMIPVLGIGPAPAIAALFLYGVLPILRNTVAGLQGIPPSLHQAAVVLGLTPWRRLRRVELPLAMPSILAGIKTAAVIDIGTATLGALVGAGGYGQPILTGIRLDDTALILEGAIPAAALALLAEAAFDLLERLVTPRGLRPKLGRTL